MTMNIIMMTTQTATSTARAKVTMIVMTKIVTTMKKTKITSLMCLFFTSAGQIRSICNMQQLKTSGDYVSIKLYIL